MEKELVHLSLYINLNTDFNKHLGGKRFCCCIDLEKERTYKWLYESGYVEASDERPDGSLEIWVDGIKYVSQF